MRYLTVILAMAVYSLEGLAQTPPPATVTMVMGYREFPTNTLIDSDQSTYHVPVGASENPTAPLALPGPNPNTQYNFLFWNTPGGVSFAPSVTFTVPTANFNATAWYELSAGGACAPNCPPSSVNAYAFSTGQDMVLPDCPIQSVNPSAAWNSTSCNVLTASSAVTITPKSLVPSDPGEVFNEWWLLGSNTPQASAVLSVGRGVSQTAIAFYSSGDACAACASLPPLVRPRCYRLCNPPPICFYVRGVLECF